MNIRQLMFYGLFGTAVSVNFVNAELRDEPAVCESGSPGDTNTPSADLSNLHPSWLFVQIPRFGVAPLQEVLEEGSPANLAWRTIGQPIQSYRPVAMHAPIPNENNGAVMVLILPDFCLGDFNGDGRVNMHDVSLFMTAYLNMDPAADLTRDSRVDVRDQILFFHLLTIPCVDGW